MQGAYGVDGNVGVKVLYLLTHRIGHRRGIADRPDFKVDEGDVAEGLCSRKVKSPLDLALQFVVARVAGDADNLERLPALGLVGIIHGELSSDRIGAPKVE